MPSLPAGGQTCGIGTLGKFYGQAERPISTGKLHALLRFHLPPIKVVVFDRPSYAAEAALGDLISGRASCLDAFSNYLFRTSLPSDAPGGTARTQEVRPSRSSRTRDSSLKSPAPTPDRDRTVSRRSEPSSRAVLMGEQPNPWNRLQLQDTTSRHRGAKPCRRCERLGKISLLSPG